VRRLNVLTDSLTRFCLLVLDISVRLPPQRDTEALPLVTFALADDFTVPECEVRDKFLSIHCTYSELQ